MRILGFILAVFVLTMLNGNVNAQDFADEAVSRPPSQVSDSIIVAFYRDFSGVDAETTQLIDEVINIQYFEGNNFDDHLENDSLYCDIDGNFKYYKIRKSGNKVLAELHIGNYGESMEDGEWTYYYENNRLLQTIYYHSRTSPDELEDYGHYEYVEEIRVIFMPNNNLPYYITREGEGYTQKFTINDVQFEQLDVRRLIYDKYMYETVGAKILNNETDI